jgi:hypothetical protein
MSPPRRRAARDPLLLCLPLPNGFFGRPSRPKSVIAARPGAPLRALMTKAAT